MYILKCIYNCIIYCFCPTTHSPIKTDMEPILGSYPPTQLHCFNIHESEENLLIIIFLFIFLRFIFSLIISPLSFIHSFSPSSFTFLWLMSLNDVFSYVCGAEALFIFLSLTIHQYP